MKKLLAIIVLSVFCLSNSYANQEEIKKMIKKNENYNLGLNKKDTTVQGVKLKPLTKIGAFNYSLKKNYGWTKYGVRIIDSSKGPVRYGDTALRFELHYEDCGFLYKNGKERDCTRSTAHHRFEIGTSRNKKSPKGYKHNQDYWYTVSFFLPKEYKFYRKQSVYQFHSSEGPYNPPFQLEILPRKGLMVKILTSEGVYEETVGDCGGSIKEDIIYCEKAEIDYLIMTLDELKNSLGKWSDLIIHAVWDKRPSEDEKNKGLFEVFINGEKKVHYTGQTMWDVGLSVMRIGIYQSKEARVATEQQMKDTPTIMFYDEIWAKKKCKDLKLDRLGYSCKDLETQSDENTAPYSVTKASQSEYIIIVKNKTDKNLLIKVRGVDKELLIEEAMKKCTDKHKEGCYVHYSSMVGFGQ
mgnify:FL=1